MWYCKFHFNINPNCMNQRDVPLKKRLSGLLGIFFLQVCFLFPLHALNDPLSIAVAKMDISISGTVADASDGNPLPGVSVMVKGTAIGVATDADGGFTLEVPSAESVLVFSYLGYTSQE